nr:MAG TPA: hypothetical protein [Caudoviricetes sp.]
MTQSKKKMHKATKSCIMYSTSKGEGPEKQKEGKTR